MPTTPSYITAQDLVDALSEPTYMAIFDDTNSNLRATVDVSSGVQTIFRRTLVWMTSWLPAILNALPPETGAGGMQSTTDNIPALYKEACLQYGVILAYRRHPELVKTYGAQPAGPLMDELVEFLERMQGGTQQVTKNDSPSQSKPGNVGGISLADGKRIVTSNTDGSSNMGDL